MRLSLSGVFYLLFITQAVASEQVPCAAYYRADKIEIGERGSMIICDGAFQSHKDMLNEKPIIVLDAVPKGLEKYVGRQFYVDNSFPLEDPRSFDLR